MLFTRVDYRIADGRAKLAAAAHRESRAIRMSLGYNNPGDLHRKLDDVFSEFEAGNVEEGIALTREAIKMADASMKKRLESVIHLASQPAKSCMLDLMIQTDPACDILWIEDGRENVDPDPLNPTCTIVWRNGLHRVVQGSARQIAERLSYPSPGVAMPNTVVQGA